MKQKPMRNFLKRAAAAAVSAATVGSMLLPVAPASAGSFASMSDTMTRLKASTTSDHLFRLTLPSAVSMDGSSTTSDSIAFDFPSGFTSSASGTWTAADFTFNDGTARTVTAVSQGAGVADVSCVSGADSVGVAVDTSAIIFRVKACGATYASSTGTTTVTFTVDGTTTDGTLTNPGTAGSNAVTASMNDQGALSAHSGTMAVSITDDDQVTVSATVDPSLTFDIDIQPTCGSESAGPYAVGLGTLTATSVTTATGHICLDLDTNASQGAVVTVQGSGAVDALESVSSGDSIGTAYAPGNGGRTLLVPGTEGYGLCVAATSSVTGSATAVAPYNGNCTPTTGGGGNVIGGVDSAAPQQILTTNSAPIDGTANGTADLVVKAAIAGTTASANDYVDVLTFIATGTF